MSSNVTRAGSTIEYGDEQFEVSPLSLREMEYLETFIQGRVIAAGRDSLPDGLSLAESDEMMRPIIAYAMDVSIMDPNGFKKLQTPAGLLRLFYVSLRVKSPDITLEKCRKMMLNPEIRENVKAAVAQLNPNPKEPLKNPPAPQVEGQRPEASANESSPSLASDSTSSIAT